MKNTAIKIVSGVLVVALVVVAALAIAGVFNSRTQNDIAFADAATVDEQLMFRNFDPNTVLYIRGKDGAKINGEPDMYIRVVDNEYNVVEMAWAANDDADGNSGLKPKAGWKEGMWYSVSLASGYEFVNAEYKDVDSFMCIVKARESTEDDTKLKDGIIELEAGKFEVTPHPTDNGWLILKVKGTAPVGDNNVFVFNNGVGFDEDEKPYSNAYVQVAPGIYEKDGEYTLTVKEADVSDVYEYIYINKSYDVQEDDIDFDLEKTEASLRSSTWYLAAMEYLYGEALEETVKEESKWIKVKFEPGFTPGTPSTVKLDISLIFTGLWKNDDGSRNTDASIVIKIANVFTPVFDVHVQNNDAGKAFDVNLDLKIKTTATIKASYAKSWSSLDEKGNKLTDIANGLASLVKKVTSDKLGADAAKPYTFAKWIIPIGNLPICIEDNLGFELKAGFAGEVGAVAVNEFEASFGVVYAGGDFQNYHNVNDKFVFDNVSLAGTAEARVGLFNEVGISAYGTISVDLGIHAGVYADVAGRLSLTGKDIIDLFKNEKSLNIIPAYYFETGIYAGLDVKGKVFGFTIAQKTLLDKKFPLYKAGHKYLPVEFTKTEEEDTIYMQNSYYYLSDWAVNALDIQSIGSAAKAMDLVWSEFDYEIGDATKVRMENNILYAKTTEEFETTLTIKSKVNKDLVKTVKIVKNPEGPTTTKTDVTFDVNKPNDCMWTVMLNASKLVAIYLDGEVLYEGSDYSFKSNKLIIESEDETEIKTNNTLRIKANVFDGKSFGVHKVVVEASRGCLELNVRIIDSADVEVDTSAKVFDKAAAASVEWDMRLHGNAIVSVMDGAEAVDSKFYSYRENADKFVVLASYFADKAVGTYALKVTLTSTEVLTLNVTVKDERAPMMNTNVYEYIKGSGSSLNLYVETYGNAANVVKSITLDGETITTKDAVIPGNVLAGKDNDTYVGTITVGSSVLPFTVNVKEANVAVVVPKKSETFYMSSDKDVVFAATIPGSLLNNLSIVGTAASNYEIKANSITIKAAYLKSLKGSNSWTGTLNGASNITLSISIINDVMPSLKADTYLTKGENFNVEWDLQGEDVAKVVVDGADVASKSEDGMVLDGSKFAYGTTEVKVYTSRNCMTFTVKRIGTPKLQSSFVVNRGEGKEAVYELDTAHLSFGYVAVDGATILASDYHYTNGLLSLSNGFVYKLAAGTYNVHVYLSDDSKLDATLTVNGDVDKVDAVMSGGAYLIYTADQLAAMATYVNAGHADADYKLMADIDMYGKTLKPIGDSSHPYTGNFDGNGYTISNLTITEPIKVDKDGYAIGMFGYIGKGGEVKNLVLNNASVSFAKSGSVSAGIVAGRNEGVISNVTIADGTVSAESKSWLDIKNAYFDLGAVVGYNSDGYIYNISVEAKIIGKVKGLNVVGIQIGGRKSLINVGAVVGYITTSNTNKTNIKNIQATASIACEADNNQVNTNGWYGNTDLEDLGRIESRVRVF